VGKYYFMNWLITEILKSSDSLNTLFFVDSIKALNQINDMDLGSNIHIATVRKEIGEYCQNNSIDIITPLDWDFYYFFYDKDFSVKAYMWNNKNYVREGYQNLIDDIFKDFISNQHISSISDYDFFSNGDFGIGLKENLELLYPIEVIDVIVNNRSPELVINISDNGDKLEDYILRSYCKMKNIPYSGINI